MESPQLAEDLSLKSKPSPGERHAAATAHNFTPSGQSEAVWIKRFREGIRIESFSKQRQVDIHYSQIAEIALAGQSTVTHQKSVLGRAIVGNAVAGQTGAIVGALSGLQDTHHTSNRFVITYWDPFVGWKQIQFENIHDVLSIVMDLAAEDLQAYRRGDYAGQPAVPDEPFSINPAVVKKIGFALAGLVAVVVLYKAVVGIASAVSTWWSEPSTSSTARQEQPREAPVATAPAPRQVEQPAVPAPPATVAPEPVAVAGGSATQVVPEAAVQIPQAAQPVAATPERAEDPVVTAKTTTDSVQPENIKPSFDCSKATLLAEVRVCANPELALLDRKMADMYAVVRQAGAVASLERDQKGWLEARKHCKDDKCLVGSYQVRLDQLTALSKP